MIEGSEPPNTRAVEAPAKLNLFLRVLGRRPDGFHDLETVVLPLDLADRLVVHAARDPSFRTRSLSLTVDGDPDLTRGVPGDETNLVVVAAEALAERAGVRGFAEITLEKRVPPAAGLGGGSGDAAATLRVLNDLWGCGLSDSELVAVAAQVGSDVPALLPGRPALARGRGELVEPVSVPELSWLLVTFDFGVSTRDAFGWWDEDGAVTGPDPGALMDPGRHGALEAAGTNPRALAALVHNDLEAPVTRRHPRVGRALELLRGAGAPTGIMCGSGPSVAGLLPRVGEPFDRSVEGELMGVSGRRPRWVSSRGSAPAGRP